MNKEREKLVVEMRKNGKTYQEIADIFGISRQRAHQITAASKKRTGAMDNLPLDKQ